MMRTYVLDNAAPAHVRSHRTIEGRALFRAAGRRPRAPNRPLQDLLQLVHLYAERGSPKYERAAMARALPDRRLATASALAEITASLAKREPLDRRGLERLHGSAVACTARPGQREKPRILTYEKIDDLAKLSLASARNGVAGTGGFVRNSITTSPLPLSPPPRQTRAKRQPVRATSTTGNAPWRCGRANHRRRWRGREPGATRARL